MFVTTEDLTLKIRDKTCVIAVGDCNTYGNHQPQVEHSILDKFCRCLEQAGYPTHSQNLECGMATSREGVAVMESLATRADILLLNFGLLDSRYTSLPWIYIPSFPDSRSRKILRVLIKLAKRGFRVPLLRWLIPSGPLVPLDEYRANVERIISLARRLNPAMWILLWGSPPLLRDANHNARVLQYNAELHDIATRCGATYLPTKPIVDSLRSPEFFLDNCPLNEMTMAAIAAEMAHAYLSQRQRTAA